MQLKNVAEPTARKRSAAKSFAKVTTKTGHVYSPGATTERDSNDQLEVTCLCEAVFVWTHNKHFDIIQRSDLMKPEKHIF